MAITTAASGGLMKNTHRHEPTWISQPPTKGAIAEAVPLSADQAPIALALSVLRNDDWMMARLAGVSSAPPMPCMALAPISSPAVGASAQSMEATANQMTPMTNTRRLPYRSPQAPPSRISDASVSV